MPQTRSNTSRRARGSIKDKKTNVVVAVRTDGAGPSGEPSQKRKRKALTSESDDDKKKIKSEKAVMKKLSAAELRRRKAQSAAIMKEAFDADFQLPTAEVCVATIFMLFNSCMLF